MGFYERPEMDTLIQKNTVSDAVYGTAALLGSGNFMMVLGARHCAYRERSDAQRRCSSHAAVDTYNDPACFARLYLSRSIILSARLYRNALSLL